MPAPARDPNKQRLTTSFEVPKGIWGYYTDVEVDQLLADLPTGSVSTTFDNTNPPVYASPAITEQPNGLPIGLSADGLEVHQPYMVGGVPVKVNGVTFLLPLIEAPASAASGVPLFEFTDAPTTQQLDGQWIGLTPDGQFIYQPRMVGGIPVVVNGKKFLLPIVEQ
jgi:hypothetical protein